MTKAKVLLKINKVKKTYPLDGITVEALKNISLVINEGEMLAIMGPSGSGKSTLMHLIGCLDRPTEGEIWLNGKNVAQLTDNELAKIRNREVGFIFQSFNLLSRTTALDNVSLPLIYAGISDSQRYQKARQILESVGLGDRLYHHPNQLSGGQQQRVAIARALINNPKLILADEPTGNLDTKSGKEIIDILKNLHKKGHTIVVVTHDPDIAKLTPRIVKMIDGEIVL